MFSAILEALRIKFKTNDTTFWSIVDERLRAAAKVREICDLIEDIIDTDPRSKHGRASGACGFVWGCTGRSSKLSAHTLTIGGNFWIGYTTNIAHGHNTSKVFIAESGDVDIRDASLVFDGVVLIDGSWYDAIIPRLHLAQGNARVAIDKDEQYRKDRDSKRANSY